MEIAGADRYISQPLVRGDPKYFRTLGYHPTHSGRHRHPCQWGDWLSEYAERQALGGAPLLIDHRNAHHHDLVEQAFSRTSS
jgi:hypothetical protein